MLLKQSIVCYPAYNNTRSHMWNHIIVKRETNYRELLNKCSFGNEPSYNTRQEEISINTVGIERLQRFLTPREQSVSINLGLTVVLQTGDWSSNSHLSNNLDWFLHFQH